MAAAAFGGLKHQCIFEKKTTSLPAENPTFLESSWTHIDSIKIHNNLPSFEGQDFHHHHSCHHDPPESEVLSSSVPLFSFVPSETLALSSSSMFLANQNHKPGENGADYGQRMKHGRSNSFSSMSSESLSMCTEGLGFESSDDIEDDIGNNERLQGGEDIRATTLPRKLHAENDSNDNNCCEALSKRSMTPSTSLRSFPPPISCIGRNGKPWVCFKSVRENGRFILKEIRIPSQEILHSYRENGRFRLQFAWSDDDDILEEDREEENDNEEKNHKQETIYTGEERKGERNKT